ncbi:hypothetical protein B0H14DRAFT_2614856 [Mycena olivaceomarginata]|nr:hypothetical protein B0H14DRAFT_2614856 [Mycena olivaceomarginata]
MANAPIHPSPLPHKPHHQLHRSLRPQLRTTVEWWPTPMYAYTPSPHEPRPAPLARHLRARTVPAGPAPLPHAPPRSAACRPTPRARAARSRLATPLLPGPCAKSFFAASAWADLTPIRRHSCGPQKFPRHKGTVDACCVSKNHNFPTPSWGTQPSCFPHLARLSTLYLAPNHPGAVSNPTSTRGSPASLGLSSHSAPCGPVTLRPRT